MSDHQTLKDALFQREVANLRADTIELAVTHPRHEVLPFFLNRVCEVFAIRQAFCILAPPRREGGRALYRSSGRGDLPGLSEPAIEAFLDDCLSQSALLRRQQGNVELIGLSFSSDGSSFGALGLAGTLPLTSSQAALLEELGATVGRILGLKRRQEIDASIVMAMDAVQEVVVITDLDGTIEYVNPAFERTTGYTRDEAVGQNPRLYKSGQHDDRFYQELWSTLKRGETWHGRLVNRRKDGTLFDEEGSITPIRNAQGENLKYFCVKRDVTEKLLLERQLWQSQKMETVGLLAGGIAHDYNNSLGAIQGFAELALQSLDDPDTVAESLAEVLKASEHSAALTSQLLAFARKQSSTPVNLAVNEAIDSMRAMIQRIVGEQVNLRIIVHDQDSAVFLDPHQLQQIVTNLCLNARDATNGRGTIEIVVDRKVFGPQDVVEKSYRREGVYALLSVRDDGCGMDAETSERIFEPFFSTKLNKGSGLGLSTVYGIVKQNDGFVELESEPGEGSRISLYFPLVAKAEPVSEMRPLGMSNEALGYRVLLVEDDPGMRKMTGKMLARLGCTTILAGSAEEAATWCQQTTPPFDLLLTDVILPGDNGVELSHSIRKLFPHIGTLFVSGYTADIVLNELGQAGVRFLRKPFTLKELRAELVQVAQDAEASHSTPPVADQQQKWSA